LSVLKAFYETGEFNTLVVHGIEKCSRVSDGVGLEDITVVGELAFLSGDHRLGWRKYAFQTPGGAFNRTRIAEAEQQGSIYVFNTSDSDAKLVPLKLVGFTGLDFHPQGISLLNNNESSWLLAVNHRRDFDAVEIFEVKLESMELIHLRTVSDPLFLSLEDVLAIGPDPYSFYVTNRQMSLPGSFMQVFEVASRRPWSYIGYCDSFNPCTKVVDGIAFANGIGQSPDGETLYISSTMDRTIQVYDRNLSSNALSFRTAIYTNSGCDNIEVDPVTGDVFTACHPKLISFYKHTLDSTELSPSQVLRLHFDNVTAEWKLEEVFLSLGQHISGSSVAAIQGSTILIGSVFTEGFLKCELS